MKKIVVAFDGLNFSDSSMDYALYLAKEMNAYLVGVFLDDFTRHSYSMAELTKYAGSFDDHLEELRNRDKETRDAAVSNFEDACQKAGLMYALHRDKNIAIQDLLHESVYADLLIINKEETLTRFKEGAPTRFIRELLADVQCPVLLVPSVFKPFENIVFLYDGEPSSVHAVKMFSYLLPVFKHLDSEFVCVKSEEESLHLPENRLMKEFMKRHFQKAAYTVLKGPVENKILAYLGHQKKQTLVVAGAYRRSRMSRMFRPSMADVLLHHLTFPLFIAHH